MSKKLIVLLALAAGLCLWLSQFRHRRQTLDSLETVRAQTAALQAKIQQNTRALESARAQIQERDDQRAGHAAKIAGLEAAAFKQNPESRWAFPPAQWPQWDSNSPYVWVRKTTATQIPVRVINGAGELGSEAGVVLALSPREQSELNAKLSQIMSNFHAVEAAATRRVDTPADLAWLGGESITIQVDPIGDKAAPFKKEYETALQQALGAQRADFLLEQSSGWFMDQFGGAEATSPSKTITLSKRKDGSYTVYIKSLGSSMMTGMPGDQSARLTNYIPSHLLPFFTDILPQPAAGTSEADGSE